jgi:hypothetical protein
MQGVMTYQYRIWGLDIEQGRTCGSPDKHAAAKCRGITKRKINNTVEVLLDLSEKLGAWDPLPSQEIHKQGFISKVRGASGSTYDAEFRFIAQLNIDMPIERVIA